MLKKVYLPEDVILNVLARLPVKSLLKFRCVSKSWVVLIDSQEFLKSHLNLSLTDSNSQKFIFEYVGYESGFRFRHLPGNFNSLQNSQNFDSAEELYSPEPLYDERKRLVGSSRGLVCIQLDDKDVICLCNPWTRKYKILPPSPLEIFPEDRYADIHDPRQIFLVGTIWIRDDYDFRDDEFFFCISNYGFGYDDIHDDYKVVRLGEGRSKKIEVYSLKSNKWKLIENLPNAMFRGANGVLLNHTLHWIVRRQESVAEESILAIDLRTEELQFLLLPDETIQDYYNFGVSDGTLCMSRELRLVGFEIWLMKDYGIKDSWTKLKVDILGLNCNIVSLKRYSESENQLIFLNMNGLCWYDLNEKRILNENEFFVLGNFFDTVESLVPLRSVDQGG